VKNAGIGELLKYVWPARPGREYGIPPNPGPATISYFYLDGCNIGLFYHSRVCLVRIADIPGNDIWQSSAHYSTAQLPFSPDDRPVSFYPFQRERPPMPMQNRNVVYKYMLMQDSRLYRCVRVKSFALF